MNLSKTYIDLLSKKISKEIGKEYIIREYGINEEINNKLIENNYPQDLIEFLKIKNGDYNPIIGSLDGIIAYNLFSAEEMLRFDMEYTYRNIKELYEYDSMQVDEKIKVEGEHFWIWIGEDVVNNGGWSQLYIDMTPSEFGVKGQVVQFVHDEDRFKVIANSFNELLENIIKSDFNFLDEYIIDYFKR